MEYLDENNKKKASTEKCLVSRGAFHLGIREFRFQTNNEKKQKRKEIKSLSEGFVKLSYVEYAEHLFLLTFHWLHLKSSCKIKKLCEGPF